MKNKVINIIKVENQGDFHLNITFDDGFSQIVNFRPFLESSHHPDIRAYLHPKRFDKYKIEHGQLMWGDCELCFPIIDLYHDRILHNQSVTMAA